MRPDIDALLYYAVYVFILEALIRLFSELEKMASINLNDVANERTHTSMDESEHEVNSVYVMMDDSNTYVFTTSTDHSMAAQSQKLTFWETG